MTPLISGERSRAILALLSGDRFEPGKTYIAGEPNRLAVYREICVHLAEMISSDNLHNGHPSTLLRSVPVENERCGSGRTETFPVLQYKRLSPGPVSQLTISLRDTNGRRLSFENLSTTLHIRNAVALGASENALGRLWLTLVTLKDSIEAERKTSFTLSSCLIGSTKDKSSSPLSR